MVAARRECDRRAVLRNALVVVREGVAALHIDEARAPGVAEAAGHRTDAALPVGVGEAAGEHRADIAADPAVLRLCADDPGGGELPVRATQQAAEEAAVAVVAGGQTGEIVVARERAAEMAAE